MTELLAALAVAVGVDDVVVGSEIRIPFNETSLVEELAFRYVVPSLRTRARDLNCHPLAAMPGKAAMNPSTSGSVISCSNVIAPGLFALVVMIFDTEATTSSDVPNV